MQGTKEVRKEKILNAKNIYLSSGKSGIRLYEAYTITETILSIREQSFSSSGNSLSEQVKGIIAGLQPGAEIKVEWVTAKNTTTGNEIKLKTNQAFTIL